MGHVLIHSLACGTAAIARPRRITHPMTVLAKSIFVFVILVLKFFQWLFLVRHFVPAVSWLPCAGLASVGIRHIAGTIDL